MTACVGYWEICVHIVAHNNIRNCRFDLYNSAAQVMSDFVRNSTGNISRVIPEASVRSPELMLAACTLIRTSVGEEIDGTGRLTSSNFAGSEYEFIATERMVGGMLVLEAIVPLGKVGSGC